MLQHYLTRARVRNRNADMVGIGGYSGDLLIFTKPSSIGSMRVTIVLHSALHVIKANDILLPALPTLFWLAQRLETLILTLQS